MTQTANNHAGTQTGSVQPGGFKIQFPQGSEGSIPSEAIGTCATGGRKSLLPAQRGAQRKKRSLITPDGDATLRHRARAVVYKRIKLGHIKRPKACERCGERGPVEAHHPDYHQPDFVAFACASCHQQAHHSQQVADQLHALARHITTVPLFLRRKRRRTPAPASGGAA